MELIVFDLDGTLLNRDSLISDFTRDTLRLLSEKGVAYTVATGRTLHASREVLTGQGFGLPQVFKNGVMIWHPGDARFIHSHMLSASELARVTQTCLDLQITPFVFTVEPPDRHVAYHPPLQNPAEKNLKTLYLEASGLPVYPMEHLPPSARIAHISAIGPRSTIEKVAAEVAAEDHLVAYCGSALEGDDLYWIDIHHSRASKGGAVAMLREMLGLERVICFGDSDNDLSMFAMADESYAPANATPEIQAAATAVIGHHDEEGIASFLRQRFELG